MTTPATEERQGVGLRTAPVFREPVRLTPRPLIGKRPGAELHLLTYLVGRCRRRWPPDLNWRGDLQLESEARQRASEAAPLT